MWAKSYQTPDRQTCITYLLRLGVHREIGVAQHVNYTHEGNNFINAVFVKKVPRVSETVRTKNIYICWEQLRGETKFCGKKLK